MKFEIKVYATSTGKRPFDEWLNDLSDGKAVAAIDFRLDRVKMGNFGQSASLGEGVYELKIDFGPGYRIYFGKIGPSIILLLCAGNKSRQQKDIDRAKKYFRDFKDRGKNNDD